MKEDNKDTVSSWRREPDEYIIRRIGKTNEEVNELGAVLARIIIQGVDEVDPSSGKTNRIRLAEEIADVIAQCELTIEKLNLDTYFIDKRINNKKDKMEKWEELLK